MIRLPGLGSGRGRPEPDFSLVIVVHNDRRVGVKSDLTHPFPYRKPSKVLNHSSGDLRLSVARHMEFLARGLAQWRNECLGDIDYGNACRDSVGASLVNNLMRRAQLIVDARLGFAVLRHDRLGLTGNKDV